MLKASVFFYQMMMIWRGQLVILQMLELCHCEDGVTGKDIVDRQLETGLIISDDIPQVNSLEHVNPMKMSLGTVIVISLVQELDEPVLSLIMEWE
jgi:hypothetical protein